MQRRERQIPTQRAELDQSGERLLVELRIPEQLVYFDGHFPGQPILPGVVTLSEIVLPLIEGHWPSLGALSSIKRLKFKELIAPGDQLELVMTLRAPSTVRFWMTREGRECCIGVLEFATR